MTIQVPDQPRWSFYCGDNLSPHDEVAMERDREEWDNEGGAAPLPTQAGAQASGETMYLADILPPPIMANRRKGTLGCAYNG
jgi:hypothetical protein